MEVIKDRSFSGERSLFKMSDLSLENVLFLEGESPLKEGKNIRVSRCSFSWKYPLWYCQGVDVSFSRFYNESHAGIWYTRDGRFGSCVFEEGKNFRHSSNIVIVRCSFQKASETLWWCRNCSVKESYAKGEYFGLGSSDIELEGVQIDGNYPFDGSKRVRARHCVFNSKDAFWNSEDVLLEDCEIHGEYFGWNSKKVVLKRCKIVSHQGFCYMDDVRLEDCEMTDSDLTFEYVSNASVHLSKGELDLKNPISGTFVAPSFKNVLLEDDRTHKDEIFIKEGELE